MRPDVGVLQGRETDWVDAGDIRAFADKIGPHLPVRPEVQLNCVVQLAEERLGAEKLSAGRGLTRSNDAPGSLAARRLRQSRRRIVRVHLPGFAQARRSSRSMTPCRWLRRVP